MIKGNLKYIRHTLKHKHYVYKFGRKYFNLPRWQLLVHDLTKFSHHEMPAYVKHFYSDDDVDNIEKEQRKFEFSYAWHHHSSHNPHHWAYWKTLAPLKYMKLLEHLDADTETLRMPERYVKEMIADWMAASITHSLSPLLSDGSPDMSKWLSKNFHSIQVHPETRLFVLSLLINVLGYRYNEDTHEFTPTL